MKIIIQSLIMLLVYNIIIIIIIVFRNDNNYFSNHHYITVKPMNIPNIRFSSIKSQLKNCIKKYSPCILLMFDLNMSCKQLFGIDDLEEEEGIYIRDIGKYN